MFEERCFSSCGCHLLEFTMIGASLTRQARVVCIGRPTEFPSRILVLF